MGKLTIVGMGPGAYDQMTLEAIECIRECQVIVGYTVYVDLIKEYFADKEFVTTPMKKEVDRCKLALEKADQGMNVVMICSGDAGVYGMAGLIYELSPAYKEVIIQVVSGVTAALSGGAVLGAPLTHDFVVLSLSDLLTPWEKIEKRIHAAAAGDFSICIYNPSSKKRADYLKRACEIIEQYQDPNLVCGYVRNIGRDQEEAVVLTLSELKSTQVDMFTTVFIGNSQTKVINGKMVTPRGYQYEE